MMPMLRIDCNDGESLLSMLAIRGGRVEAQGRGVAALPPGPAAISPPSLTSRRPPHSASRKHSHGGRAKPPSRMVRSPPLGCDFRGVEEFYSRRIILAAAHNRVG